MNWSQAGRCRRSRCDSDDEHNHYMLIHESIILNQHYELLQLLRRIVVFDEHNHYVLIHKATIHGF